MGNTYVCMVRTQKTTTASLKRVITVCHDAGAAEIISAYVKKNPHSDQFFCIALGPAQKVFLRKGLDVFLVENPERSPQEIFTALSDIDFVLTGTSWSTQIDLHFIAAAKSRGIRTATYLDHWVNYPERFGFPAAGWEQSLPDEIWVGDEYGYKIAKQCASFPVVRLVPNEYFDELKTDIQKNKDMASYVNRERRKYLLYISEPISVGAMRRYGDPRYYGFTEQDVLQDILATLIRVKKERAWGVVVRLHPSDPANAYRQCIEEFSGKIPIRISSDTSLVEDVLGVHVVVGMESMALVTALFADKPVVSYIPSTKKACSLPFPEIQKMHNIAELEEYLTQF